MPIGYDPILKRLPKADKQDIDVLFYGSMSDRRRAVLQEIQRSGLTVRTLFGVYGKKRDADIARAKVVLNMHHNDRQRVFEIARVSYLLSNRKAVVGEIGADTSVEPDIREAVHGVPFGELAAACRELVGDRARRRELEQRGHDIFAKRDIKDILANALADRMGESRAGP